MGKSEQIITEELARPFNEEDLEWRVQRCGHKRNSTDVYCIVLAYVTNRAVFERLDSVMGIFGWQNEYKELASGGLLCGISLKFDGLWVTKWDGADKTQVEPVKGMISGSHKRAGVPWGIGRYLYQLPVTFGDVASSGSERGSFLVDPKNKNSDRIWFNWNPPKMPSIFLPKGGN